MKETEIIGWRSTLLSVPVGCYRKIHTPSDRVWDCEWGPLYEGHSRQQKLELINEWNHQGFGEWQYYM
jgi:hypothetical protein